MRIRNGMRIGMRNGMRMRIEWNEDEEWNEDVD